MSTVTTTPYAPRPYCELCIIWFATPQELTNHLNTDLAHTPYSCSPPVCQSRFKTLLELQKHQLLECPDAKRRKNEGYCSKCVIWCEGGKEGLEKHKKETGCSLNRFDSNEDSDYDDEEMGFEGGRESKKRRAENANGTRKWKGKGKERALSPSDSDTSDYSHLPHLHRRNQSQLPNDGDILSDEDDDLRQKPQNTTAAATTNSGRKSLFGLERTTSTNNVFPTTTPPNRGSINRETNSPYIHNRDRDRVIGTPNTRTTGPGHCGDWDEDSDTSSCTLADTDAGSDYDDDDSD